METDTEQKKDEITEKIEYLRDRWGYVHVQGGIVGKNPAVIETADILQDIWDFIKEKNNDNS